MMYSYSSYLGVPVFRPEKNYLPVRVLGMTNSREISIQRALPKDVAEFVLMHEEEHVKDMDATEYEVDQRALRRFLAKNGRITRNVRKLMKKRHGIGGDEKQFSLKRQLQSTVSNTFISYLYEDSNW